MSTDSLAEFHELTYGEQDKVIATRRFNSPPTYTSILQSRTLTIPCSNKDKLIELIPTGQQGIGVANIGLQGNWRSAHLLLGGKYVSATYANTGHNGFLMTDCSNCIPSLPFQTVHLEVRAGSGEEPFTVTYDIVETHCIDRSHCRCFPFRSIQYAGEDVIINTVSKHKVGFDHPVERLFVRTAEPIGSAVLQLCVNDRTSYVSLVKKEDTLWELNCSEHTINFSRLHQSVIIIEGGTPGRNIDIWCTSIHILHIVGGVVEMAFSR